jgi:type I restriction enzyme S subunit
MKGWQVKTLGEVTSFKGGGTPSKEVARYWKGDIPWVSPKDMKSLEISASIDTISMDAVDNSATSMIPKGAVLIVVRSGILARTVPVGITTRDLTVNQDIKALCPSKALDSNFLLYFMLASERQILGVVSRGATVHRIETAHLKQLRIPLPPLDEQRRIVAILDEAFAGLAVMRQHAEANLKNARALFDSHLNAIFSQRGDGWVVKKLGEVADCCLGKMLDKAKNRGMPMPYLRNINVRWFEFDLSDLLEMPFEDHEFDRYSAVSGDVLICEGGYPGRAAIWQSDEPIFFQKAIHRVRFADRDRAQWLVYYLWLLDGSGQLKSHFTGAGIQHFTGQALKKLEIPLPPLDEQRRIVAQVVELQTETNRLEALYRQKLAAIDELKQSVLHRAFSGQLTGEAIAA